MKDSNLSRRRFLGMVGAAGGSTAVYQAAMAMGLMQETGAPASLALAEAAGSGKRIAVLGAGLSGLAVAFELERAGYEVTVLEASHRIGGRSLTLRHGDRVDEMGYEQVCNFDDDPELYFNAGPARIPGHHRRVLSYCKTLGVELQIKANSSRNAWRHDTGRFDGKPIRNGQAIADSRGFIAELVYKAADQNAFDQPLSAEDAERLKSYATGYGDLGANGRYAGTTRAGYREGFALPAEAAAHHDFGELLDSWFWTDGMHMRENPDWGEPLMEAKGGMDNVARGFARHIRSPILTNAQVQSIMNRANGIDIVYQHDGERKKLAADWCFNCIPTHFMPGIPNNFSKDYREGLAALRPGNFFKIGFQMRERFWEREGIYGGMTSTNQRINQIWYPSNGIHTQKGVVLGAYAFMGQSNFFERMTPAERLEYAANCGEKIHPGYAGHIEAGVSIPWGRMNHMMGCGTQWLGDTRERYYELLQQPDGRHYMIGDQISYHPSWQEGAFASAEVALLDFDQRMRAHPSSLKKG